MKVAVVQMGSGPDKARNIATALRLVEQAAQQQAKFVLLPEIFNYRDGKLNDLKSIKEKIPGVSTEPLRNLAKQYKIFILAGSIYEEIKNSDKVYSTSAFIDGQGNIAAVYRKIHLFDANLGKTIIKESALFVAGQDPAMVSLGEFSIGLSVCYDVRFPELYRHYAQKGAQILVVPSAFTKTTGQAHWETLLRARAIENLCYVLAPNQIGAGPGGVECYGHSMAVGPWGEVLAKGSGEKEEIVYADISKSKINQCRRTLPFYKNKK